MCVRASMCVWLCVCVGGGEMKGGCGCVGAGEGGGGCGSALSGTGKASVPKSYLLKAEVQAGQKWPKPRSIDPFKCSQLTASRNQSMMRAGSQIGMICGWT